MTKRWSIATAAALFALAFVFLFVALVASIACAVAAGALFVKRGHESS